MSARFETVRMTEIAAFVVFAAIVSPSSRSAPVPTPGEHPGPLRLMHCVAAGDYRWVEVNEKGRLRTVRANRAWRNVQAGTRLMPAPVLDDLTRLFPDLSWEPRPSAEKLEAWDEDVETEYYAVVLGDRSTVFPGHRKPSGPWPPLLQIIHEQVRQELEPLPARPFVAALPERMLPCLGADAPRMELGALPPPVNELLTQAIEQPGAWQEISTSTWQTLRQSAFQRGEVVQAATPEGLSVLVLVGSDR